MSDEYILTTPITKNLSISKGARHCRIVDEEDNTIFRTTNQRDAETYLALVEENRRLHRLLESRGVAPHRIYVLDQSESRAEVVIVAKASSDAVVVRDLNDGLEQVVELEDLTQLPEGNYFSGAERPMESIHISVRFDTESETLLLHAHRSADSARAAREVWRRATFEYDKEEGLRQSWSNEQSYIYSDEIDIED